MNNLDFNYIIELFPLLGKATKITLSLALFSLIISFILALIMATIRYYNIKILSPIIQLYVSFFRGTPIITQLFLIYFGIFTINDTLKSIPAYNIIVISLSLNSAAYMSETIRASFNSVDKGQIEASISIGMNKIQAMRRIIFPQAMRIALPSLSNSLIDLIKCTSLAFTIGVPEMMALAGYEGGRTFKYFEIYIVVAIIYWGLSTILNFFQKILEKNLNKYY